MLRRLMRSARRGRRITSRLSSVVEAAIVIWIVLAIGAGILAPSTADQRATGVGAPVERRPDAVGGASVPANLAAVRGSPCVDVASRWLESLGSGVATTNDVKRHLARRHQVAALIVLAAWTKLTHRAFWVGYPRARAIAMQKVGRRCARGATP
jgi:hypothetical protein